MPIISLVIILYDGVLLTGQSSKLRRIYSLALFNKSVMQILVSENLRPNIVLTNDWFTSLVNSYRKKNKETKEFFEVCDSIYYI